MTTKNKAIVIGIALKNGASTLKRAVKSVISQKNTKREIIILIANDNSTDNWKDQIADYILSNNIIIKDVNYGKVYKTRNFINDYSRQHIANAEYIGRLDSDDYLVDDFVISKLEKIIDTFNPDVIMSGNELSINNQIIDRVNFANPKLLNNQYLKEKLEKMSKGIADGELPSCNTFIRKNVLINYPEIGSAEDHWFTVELLLNKHKFNIHITPDLRYSVYSLSGKSTVINRKKKKYLESRKNLSMYFTQEINKPEYLRIEKALALLKQEDNVRYYYLGQGFSGVVFHDNKSVYKVHIPLNYNKYNEIDKLIYLKEKQNIFRGTKHFYEIDDIYKIRGVYILKYKYEISKPITFLSEEDYISFLGECWERKVICKSLTKENFIRVNGQIKLIDYEIEPFNDNLFLNMVARAYLQIHYLHLPKNEFDKLKRSAINNFNLTELNGFKRFLSAVFSNICYQYSSKSCITGTKKANIKSFTDENDFIEYLTNSNEKEITVKFNTIKNIDIFARRLISNNLFLKNP